MKKLITIFAIFFASTTLFALDVADYVTVKGNPKSYTMTDYVITSQFGDYFRTPEMKVVHTLSGGRETEFSVFTVRNVLVNKVVHSHNAIGNIISQTATGTEGEVIWKKNFDYNANGSLKEISEYNAKEELRGRTIYTYKDENLADESTYAGDGTLLWKTTYEYNDTGKKIMENDYYPDGALYESKRFAYLADGAIEKITTAGAKDEIVKIELFRYEEPKANASATSANVNTSENFSSESENAGNSTNSTNMPSTELGENSMSGVNANTMNTSNSIANKIAEKKLIEVRTLDKNEKTLARKIIAYDERGNLSRISDYNVSEKFGKTVNDLADQRDYVYVY